MNSCNSLTVFLRLINWQRSNSIGHGQMDCKRTTTKHNKAQTMSILLVMYTICVSPQDACSKHIRVAIYSLWLSCMVCPYRPFMSPWGCPRVHFFQPALFINISETWISEEMVLYSDCCNVEKIVLFFPHILLFHISRNYNERFANYHRYRFLKNLYDKIIQGAISLKWFMLWKSDFIVA